MYSKDERTDFISWKKRQKCNKVEEAKKKKKLKAFRGELSS
jgi:hypothetical protein